MPRLYLFAVAWQHLALLWQLVAFFGHPFHRFSHRFTHWEQCSPLCLYACVPAGTRVGRLAGRRADRFACKGKGLSQRLYSFAGAWQHLALSWQLVAFFGHPFHRLSWRFAHREQCSPLCLSTMPLPVCLCAGRHKGRRTGRQARMLASKQAGVPTVSPAKERCFLKGCISLPLRGSLWRSLPDLATAFPIAWMVPTLWLCHHFNACVPAGRHKGRQTGRPVNRQAGKNACQQARKYACRFANLKAYRQAAMLFPFAWQHLALSWQLVAFLTRISALENALPLHPSGRAKPKARTAAPGPSFFWAAKRYRATDALQGR